MKKIILCLIGIFSFFFLCSCDKNVPAELVIMNEDKQEQTIKITTTENKDELLQSYGIASFSKADFQEISPKDYISYRENAFGYQILVQDKKEFLRKYDGALMDNASLEEIMVFYHRR